MGVIRGGLLVVVAILLLFSFLVGNVLLTLVTSISYENVEDNLISIVEDLSEGPGLRAEFEANFGAMDVYCNQSGNSEHVYVDQEFDITIVVPCSVVTQGSEEVLDYATKSIVENFYYKSYDCDFFDCFDEQEVPFFLVSENSKNYLAEWFYVSLVISIVLIVLLFLLVEVKSNGFIILGILAVVSSFPFSKLSAFFSLFVSDNKVLAVLPILFSESSGIFWIVFIFGLIVFLIGLGVKFFHFGWKIGVATSKRAQMIAGAKKVGVKMNGR